LNRVVFLKEFPLVEGFLDVVMIGRFFGDADLDFDVLRLSLQEGAVSAAVKVELSSAPEARIDLAAEALVGA
jgi:hypothetical protein